MPYVLAQAAQVLFMLAFAPLLRGILDRFRARLAFRTGPPIWQPYRDLVKWFGKETVRTDLSTWVSALAPVGYFIAPVLVTMLIPVLVNQPLPLAFMGDMLGGGMILAAGGALLLFAALDSGGPYPGLGASRVRLIGVLAEPMASLAVFTAAAVGRATIPFVVNRAFSSGPWIASASHLLVVLAWFLLLVAETGKSPVDNPASTQELSLIDPARTFEAAGPDLALYEWGGWLKYAVLSTVLVNVLGSPWGLAGQLTVWSVVAAVPLVAGKLLLAGLATETFSACFAKLRLLRLPEYLLAGSVVALLAAVATIRP